MADIKKTVKFNDSYVHDGVFNAGDVVSLNAEQYECASKLKCSYDANKPLIEDVPASQGSTAPKEKAKE